MYSNLTEALDRAQAIYGPFDTWFITPLTNNYETNRKIFSERVTEFMKISKDCGTDSGCYPTVVKGFDGGESPDYNSGGNSYVLPDGVVLLFKAPAGYDTVSYANIYI